MATGPQLQKLAIIRSHRGVDREAWFDWIEAETGRRVQSNRELSVGEASHLLTVCEAMEARRG